MIKTTKKTKSIAVKPAVSGNSPEKAAAVFNKGPEKVVAVSGNGPEKAAVLKTPAPKVTLPKPASRISLELVKPEAKEVYVAGSFNGWVPEKSPLANKGNGRWVGDLAVGPGRYEYLFVVDGKWLPDPNARETVQNPFGGKNSVLLVSE